VSPNFKDVKRRQIDVKEFEDHTMHYLQESQVRTFFDRSRLLEIVNFWAMHCSAVCIGETTSEVFQWFSTSLKQCWICFFDFSHVHSNDVVSPLFLPLTLLRHYIVVDCSHRYFFCAFHLVIFGTYLA
jgi:hypothetical protein